MVIPGSRHAGFCTYDAREPFAVRCRNLAINPRDPLEELVWQETHPFLPESFPGAKRFIVASFRSRGIAEQG